ncbi:MAG TPA: hypothetical protein VGR07_23160 [Thermoanaerobaculia bacterium]|nr:hypothetical protein [Thermoanaerobaculia bacterium]
MNTWKSSPKISFPGLLASDQDFDSFDIYLESFPTYLFDKSYAVYQLAEKLESDMRELFHKYEKIYFVCHSMGGLVVRNFLLTYRDGAPSDPARLSRVDSIPMIYFFATPTGGASIANVARFVSRNPQFSDMLASPNNSYLLGLHGFVWAPPGGTL